MMPKIVFGIITSIILATTIGLAPMALQSQLTYAIKIRVPETPIATSGDNVYVAWTSTKTDKWEIMFRASNDNGATFQDKINLSNSPKGQSVMPDITAEGENVFVTWGDNKTGNMEIYMSKSTDGGETFSTPLILNSTGDAQISYGDSVIAGTSSAPDIVFTATESSGDNTYVMWYDNKTGNWEVMFARSGDRGNTFEDTDNLSNSSDTRSDNANISVNGKNVYVSWWETDKDDKQEAMIRVSNDDGATFGPALRLSTNGTIG